MRRRSARLVIAAATAVTMIGSSAQAIEPEICEVAVAFDAALKERFYRANYVAEDMDCRFVGAAGCRFDIGRGVVIRVSHLGATVCDESGQCSFDAIQVCAEGGPACRELMYDPQVAYRVDGAMSERAGGGVRLDDWFRSPAGTVEAQQAALTFLADACPDL